MLMSRCDFLNKVIQFLGIYHIRGYEHFKNSCLKFMAKLPFRRVARGSTPTGGVEELSFHNVFRSTRATQVANVVGGP